MPTFDIVNKLDMQAADNAFNTANRRISQRYDLKDAKIVLELNKKEKTARLEAPDDMKLRAAQEILLTCLAEQGLSPKSVKWGEREEATLGRIRLHPKLLDGIDKDTARDLVKRIKDSGVKVKTAIQDEQVRVDGKKIDDLQEIIALLKDADLPTPLQFVNMKR